MRVVKAPESFSKARNCPAIFLAGSIEMGVAEEWQKKVEAKLQDRDCLVVNPRRDDWDASWEQTIENEQFHAQVTWEQNSLDIVDFIFMYF